MFGQKSVNTEKKRGFMCSKQPVCPIAQHRLSTVRRVVATKVKQVCDNETVNQPLFFMTLMPPTTVLVSQTWVSL